MSGSVFANEGANMKYQFFACLVFVTFFQIKSWAQIQVTGLKTSGEACPEGSVQVQVAPDGSSFTVLDDRLVLSSTPGSPNARTQCQVTVNIRKPLMMGFTIESADFRGFIALDPGMIAEQKVSISTAPVKELQKISAEFGQQVFRGPIQQDYILSTVRPIKGSDILNCVPPRENTKIVINTDLRIRVGSQNGFGEFTVDSVDGKVRQTYRLKKQDCAQQLGNALGTLIDLFGKKRK